LIPAAIESLIVQFARFPGVGRRSAERLAFDLLAAPESRRGELIGALESLGQVGLCPTCGYFTQDGDCTLCCAERDPSVLLVVEKTTDVVAVEKAGAYKGQYHVLGGHLSPLKGITPDRLHIQALLDRASDQCVREVILATSASVEGDATAIYLTGHMRRPGLLISRFGRGMPVGGSLELTDAGTLRLALEGRRGVDL
jgi:recombination protein RecR